MNKGIFIIASIIFPCIAFGTKRLDPLNNDRDALRYCSKHKNTYVVLIWPIAEKTHNIESIEEKLKRVSKIIYKKEVELNRTAQLLFIRQLYGAHESRIGTYNDNFKMAREKRKSAFNTKTNLRIYLVETDTFSKLDSFKRNIRSHFRLNLMHIDDSHEESLDLAHIVFSLPTLEFLNTHTYNYFERFETLLKEFKSVLSENNIDHRSCSIVGDAVLAAYGIKECEVLHFVQEGTKQQLPSTEKFINLTNQRGDSTSLLKDPNQYFYYQGLKFERPESGSPY